MQATAISHIAICTRDMEKSLAFYRDILGMTVLFDGMTDPTEGGKPTELPAGPSKPSPGQPEFWRWQETDAYHHQSPWGGH